ncbi:type II toxin-antitoxin system VapC family toxin [Methylobacterium isbiliense]|jgi:predicted nucleic acid-binding protein|uniref:type II toxin-antitoxin system VapC family toxin n=1 Tax=Methylobacterium isbiliense TaxID=315478 RepID=UPI001EDF3A4F|nr:PIN domain-containing protein [Methylobacterium isbiliense]MDN3625583.1 PIN domain-containing protein [Methylobacterium isbiliense]
MEYRYWDSDCFLGWLQAEPDKEARCKEVLKEARAGNITIVTSALTIAEVLVYRGHARVPPEKRLMVEKFFKNEFIIVRSVTRRVAEKARELVWDFGIFPKDAVHVATAVDAKLQVMNTFDHGLIKKSGLVGEPKLLIEKPIVAQTRLPLPMFDDDDT